MQPISLNIACSQIKAHVPADKTLTERLLFAMRHARTSDLFFMEGHVTDDDRFRAALGGVLLAGSEEDRDLITRSLKPLRALSALMDGVPVDFRAFEIDDDIIPLRKLWRESETP